ncbi:hypothetical protein [Brevibacterium litoralis]|uniref:hypothetical protein n=1 Tax=Brevibacterium litoralis TaxID=3138935 RepID=UPI0032EAD9FA
MNDAAADLLQEIRRLRVRMAGIKPADLEAGGRVRIQEALASLSALAADARPVPDLGDRVLGDQLVVLLTDCLPEYGAEESTTRRALAVATQLRQEL